MLVLERRRAERSRKPFVLMLLDAMQEMATKVTPMPATEPGTYRFKANFSMAGRWQLSLGAKVQGETGTVANKLVITAQP